MLLRDAIPQYLAFGSDHGEYTKSTLQTWGPNLRAFARWLVKEIDIDPLSVTDITLDNLERYRASLRRRALRPRTIHSHFSALRSFGDWLVRKKLLPDNPAIEVELPRLDAPERVRISEEQVTALLAASHRIPQPDRNLYRAVLYVLCTTGVRHAELLALKLADVEMEKKRLIIRHGKGDKRRIVYMPDDCVDALTNWLADRLDETRRYKYEGDYLFMLSRVRQVGTVKLKSILATAASIAGMEPEEAKKMQPHALRHAFATRLMRNGADIKSIGAALGHSTIQTTGIYLHTDEARLLEISPLSSTAYAPEHLRVPEPPPAPEAPTPPQFVFYPAPPYPSYPPPPSKLCSRLRFQSFPPFCRRLRAARLLWNTAARSPRRRRQNPLSDRNRSQSRSRLLPQRARLPGLRRPVVLRLRRSLQRGPRPDALRSTRKRTRRGRASAASLARPARSLQSGQATLPAAQSTTAWFCGIIGCCEDV